MVVKGPECPRGTGHSESRVAFGVTGEIEGEEFWLGVIFSIDKSRLIGGPDSSLFKLLYGGEMYIAYDGVPDPEEVDAFVGVSDGSCPVRCAFRGPARGVGFGSHAGGRGITGLARPVQSPQ